MKTHLSPTPSWTCSPPPRHRTRSSHDRRARRDRIAEEVRTPFPDTEDFAPFLSRIRDSGAVATFCFYAGSAAVSFVQQYAAFGLAQRIPLYGTAMTDGDVLTAQGRSALGVRTSVYYSAALDNPANRAFVSARVAAG